MQPQTILFSSSGSYAVAEGLYENLKDRHNVTLWKQFFGENRTTPLWTFLKKLFHYDYAILVLANDSLVYDTVTQGQQAWIPKDNVIFELGATMARLGPQKTILLVPHEPEVHLPGYFDDVRPLLFTYTNQEQFSEEEKIQATAAAADGISALLDTVSYETFHSELPAQGLAHAYLNNFFLPVRNSGIAQELVINDIPLSWTPAAGIIFTIIVPGEIMGRQRANDYFEQLAGCYKISFKTNDGRDIGVYALPRKKESDPLHILDIPTTLLTAENIIERIELFWREKDRERVSSTDNEFMNLLRQREILNFQRTLTHMIEGRFPNTYIVSDDELRAHLDQNK